MGNGLTHWCEFCQCYHSSSSCYHPSAGKYNELARQRDYWQNIATLLSVKYRIAFDALEEAHKVGLKRIDDYQEAFDEIYVPICNAYHRLEDE